jgi:hypothetical protein
MRCVHEQRKVAAPVKQREAADWPRAAGQGRSSQEQGVSGAPAGREAGRRMRRR